MNWTLEKDFTFEASHRLPGHDGKCVRLHGHSWKGTVIVRGGTLHEEGPKKGMLVDYGDIKAAINPIVEGYLDHWHLNDTVSVNPTSENIARWVYKQLVGRLPGLAAVRIEETCTSRATYSEGGA